MRITTIIRLAMACALVALAAHEVQKADAQEAPTDEIGHTPPRLSLIEGEVSFWRPGADDWVQAQINTALAPGDQLYVHGEGNLELQVGGRAFVRGGTDTQIGLESQEPGFLQLRVTTGRVALDLRGMGPEQMVAMETPHGAFKFDSEGYFRLDVDEGETTMRTHRAGRATLTTVTGETIPIGSNTAVVISGDDHPNIVSRIAPALDDWDQWNYARTDGLMETESARYVSSDVYGLSDLDRYGTWRVVPTYGPVWMPRGIAAGWVPYSSGAWVRDPYYGWTWVDTAPWGWAPYHYGRWVYVNNYWCWAPGPRIVRPVYAPALVAFFGAPGVQVSISAGVASVGWVSLGWGEPLIPWWGRPGFIHRPWWGGWAGPRYINNRVVHRHTVVNLQHIHLYRNTRIRNGMVVVHRDHFGRGPIAKQHRIGSDPKHLKPMHAAPRFTASSAAYVPNRERGSRPPDRYLKRSVVTYRRDPAPTMRSGDRPTRRDRQDERIRIYTPESRPQRPKALPAQRPSPVAAPAGKPGAATKVLRPLTPRIEAPKERQPSPRRAGRPDQLKPQSNQRLQPMGPDRPRIAPPDRSPRPDGALKREAPRAPSPVRREAAQPQRPPTPMRSQPALERPAHGIAAPPAVRPSEPSDRGPRGGRRDVSPRPDRPERFENGGERFSPSQNRPESYQRERGRDRTPRTFQPRESTSTPPNAGPGRGSWRGWDSRGRP